jgi:hypothetical protein
MTAESEDPRALIETPLQQSRGSALFVKIRLIRGSKNSNQSAHPDAHRAPLQQNRVPHNSLLSLSVHTVSLWLDRSSSP